jgi:phospholipid/cholesterol/gamma-HCH transport system substrate-binding protein
MPSSKKVTWAQLRVGLVALAAMVLLGVLIFLITGDTGLFSEKVIIHTYMRDSAAVVRGSAVRLNGILIGEVKDVTLSGSNDPARVVRMDLEIRREFLDQTPVDSVAAVSAENVLGAKFINIKKGVSSETVKPGGEIAALDVQGFEEVVQQSYALLTSLQGILKRVDAIVSVVEAGKGSIGKLLVDEELYNRLNASVADVQKVTAAISSGRGTIGKLLYDEALYQDLRATIGRLDALMLDVQQGKGTAGRFIQDPALYNEAQNSIAELRKMLADLNAGQGTAGKLLKSEELHSQIASALAKIDTMLAQLNSGQGTLGQLLVNPQLYDSINGLTREMHELMKDFRANPRKFLRIRVSLF